MSSPLRPNPSAANRGLGSLTRRKRSLGPDEDNSSAPPPSSPPPSSPPVLPFGEGDDDDDDDDMAAEDGFIQDIDDIDEMAEDEDGIDLFADTFERDYRDRGPDNYEAAGIDDEGEHEELDIGTRRRLEAQLNKRDRELARRRTLPAAFLQDDDLDGTVDLTQLRRTRHVYDEERSEMDLDEMEDELTLEDMADIKAENVTEWVATPAVRRSIYREFKSFLTEFTDKDGTSIYGTIIRNLGEENAESLTISYPHLSEAKSIIAYFVANAPTEVLKIFDEVAMEATLLHYPDYHRIHSEIHVRITDLPVRYTLRQLRQSHLNCLVCVSGVVTRRTGVFPQLRYVMFNCTKCGITLGPFEQASNAELKITFCQNCQGRGPFTLNSEKTEYRSYQRITLQESPGTVPSGRLPRHREVILLADLIDAAKPGDEVEITGIYRNQYDMPMTEKSGIPVFGTIIEANHIKKSHDQMASFDITEDDAEQIRALARDPNIIDRIVASIAPSIYGHEDVKTAVALSLFGGVSKEAQGKMAIRGDINVLLLGDPGTAKSQVLKYVEKTAHRAVFSTGQGASAVGLTANVRRDPMTHEWTLEGGAMVLADRGTCLIDEFDKMNDQDRTSIHEAMEQQTISVSKGGIVTTLQARCAIIAAANPINGRYRSTLPFSKNVNLTEPILSRFDLLCVVRDTVQTDEDERLARFVVESHYRANPLKDEHGNPVADPDGDPDAAAAMADDPPASRPAHSRRDAPPAPIPQELLRKYIVYARRECRPKLYQIDQNKVADVFADMRRESLATGAYPITVRHLESIMRLAEAFAKMRLAEYCSAQDIDRAIAVTVESFISSQKVSCKKALNRAFAKYLLSKPGRKQAAARRSG
ncbi:hypothetical protein VTO42DRAFT_1746 [Malbranchea cinnamomea]